MLFLNCDMKLFTFTCMNSVPKSASVVTPPVNTRLIKRGGLSFISLTVTVTLRSVSSLGSKMLWLAGEWMQSSLALTSNV